MQRRIGIKAEGNSDAEEVSAEFRHLVIGWNARSDRRHATSGNASKGTNGASTFEQNNQFLPYLLW